MIWMSWRQFRVQAFIGAVALVVLGAYLAYLGTDIRDAYAAYRTRGLPMDQFLAEYHNLLLFLAAGAGLIPAVLGAFWGAPLIARELETGTHRLVWNQSVTRGRWLAGRLAVVVPAGMLLAGALSALLTWAAGRVDQVAGDRFSGLVFGARDLAPVGYAAFALTFGAVAGLLVRRTLPAMALTFLTVIALQVAVPNLVRPHFMPAERLTVPMTAAAINQARGLGSITGAAVVTGVAVPDAWVTHTSELRTADGRPLSEKKFNECFADAPKTGATGTFGDTAVCLGGLNLHVDLEYQPNDRYWRFQGIELGLYLALAGLLLAFGLWRMYDRGRTSRAW
jgi:hypothetical protein